MYLLLFFGLIKLRLLSRLIVIFETGKMPVLQ